MYIHTHKRSPRPRLSDNNGGSPSNSLSVGMVAATDEGCCCPVHEVKRRRRHRQPSERESPILLPCGGGVPLSCVMAASATHRQEGAGRLFVGVCVCMYIFMDKQMSCACVCTGYDMSASNQPGGSKQGGRKKYNAACWLGGSQGHKPLKGSH
jgi:hypothetical protein